MSAQLNIATPAELAEKEAYINDDLVTAYIQENEDVLGNITYTLSFIQQDAVDPALSNVVELDYARASEVAAARDFYEMRFVVTDTSGSGGQLAVISEYGDAALLDLGADKPVLTRIDVGTYGFSAGFSLADAQVSVGSILGVVLNGTDARFSTSKIVSAGAGVDATFVDADDLLKLTNIILTVPKFVVDSSGVVNQNQNK